MAGRAATVFDRSPADLRTMQPAGTSYSHCPMSAFLRPAAALWPVSTLRRVPSSLLRAVSTEPGLDNFRTIDEGVWDEKYADKYPTLPFGVSGEQGPRESMEDHTLLIPRARCGFLFAACFDGHGGNKAAEYLTQKLYGVFSDAIDEKTYGEECSLEERDVSNVCCPVELSSVLSESFLQTDKELLKWLEENAEGEEKNSGSTATVVLVRRDKVVVANVGDSRAVLCRKGAPLDLSVEHRVSGKGEVVRAEVARVEAAGGWVADGRVCDVLAVSRAFGDAQMKGAGLQAMLDEGVREQYWNREFADSVHFTGDPVVALPDVTEAGVGPEDEFLILATDGLWDVMPSRDAVVAARKEFKAGRDAQYVANKLTALALKRYTGDNVAVVVVDLGGPPDGWKRSSRKSGKESGVWNMF